MNIKQTNSDHSVKNSDSRKKNIIEEMNALNQRMQYPSNEIYKISSSWDSHLNAQNNKNIEIMIKEILNYIIKMDTVLTKIEISLSQNKSENKRGTRSFWGSSRL